MTTRRERLLELARDYLARLKHLRHEEMDTATFGLWGYWKRQPYWPRTVVSQEPEA